ncbi:hypothetical protein AB0F36_22385 [Streptomyces sp. NPDC029080]
MRTTVLPAATAGADFHPAIRFPAEVPPPFGHFGYHLLAEATKPMA